MRKRPLAEMNVVPYIDVMLVLLVIFMITTPLLTQGVKVDLPKTSGKTLSAPQEKPIIVTIDSRGNYFLNIAKEPYKPITIYNLSIRVAATLQLANERHQKREVYVKGDSAVDYGKVVKIMVLLQHAGAKNIGLITQNTSKINL